MALAGVGDARQVVDRARVRRAGARDDRERRSRPRRARGASSAAASASPVSRPRSSPGTSTMPTSITRAAVATEECTLSATAIFHPAAGRPPRRGGGVRPGRDQRREVAGRAAAHEHAAGPVGEAGEVGEPAQRLVLRPDRAGAVDPPGGDRRRRPDDQVEEHGGLRGRAGHERHRRRVVGRDRGGREHLGPDPQGLLAADALAASRSRRRGASAPRRSADPSSGCGLAIRFRAYATIAFESASVSSV